MDILLIGSQGPQVVALQRALNDALPAWPALTPDGVYGGLTFDAVMEFQLENWLVMDGIAGPCTQNALYKTEAYDPILNSPPFIPQPTQQTCWAASTAMITNANVPAVIARTPADLILADGSLANASNTNDAFTSATRFAQANSIRLISAASSLTLDFIRTALADGPLMFDMLWEPGKYIAGTGSPGHMIVVVGIRGDNDPSGVGTTLRIFDPWAPNVGEQRSFNFFKWMNEVSTRTYHVYQK